MLGLIVAVVVKYADNILKGFATSISIIISSIISIWLFNFEITIGFIVGSILVMISTVFYESEFVKKEEYIKYFMSLRGFERPVELSIIN